MERYFAVPVLKKIMMIIGPFGHKAVGDLSGVSETYSHQPQYSPLIEACGGGQNILVVLDAQRIFW
jgi:hypothetical protein